LTSNKPPKIKLREPGRCCSYMRGWRKHPPLRSRRSGRIRGETRPSDKAPGKPLAGCGGVREPARQCAWLLSDT
jgi:hypothetical protein